MWLFHPQSAVKKIFQIAKKRCGVHCNLFVAMQMDA